MKENIRVLTQTMEYNNSPFSEESLRKIESEIHMTFPAQYREFMLETGGAEGMIGENSYLVIWPAEEIIPCNKYGKIEEFTPGFIQFASDGGGMAYVFDKRQGDIFIAAIPDDSIHIEDAIILGKTFEEFLQSLYDAK